MKKYLAAFLFFPAFIHAQDTSKANNQVYEFVQQMPKFNGDVPTYISDHFVYPQEAMDKGVQGTVYVSFIVEKDGSITRTHVMRGVEHSLDSAAVACVSSMPKWMPGMQNGQPVRVRYSIPIRFRLPTIDTSSVNPSTPPRIK